MEGVQLGVVDGTVIVCARLRAKAIKCTRLGRGMGVPGHYPVGYQPASVEDGSDGDEAKGCAYGLEKGKGMEEW